MSSILETKLPDGRDMLVITGIAQVDIGRVPSLAQGGLDPALDGCQDVGWLPPLVDWRQFIQMMYVGPSWYQLDKKDVVPVVSPATVNSSDISESYSGRSGYGVLECWVDVLGGRIRLGMKVAVKEAFGDGHIHPEWSHDLVIGLNYSVTAVGYKSKPGQVVPLPEAPHLKSCSNLLPIINANAICSEVGYPVSNAVDNNPSTRWACQGVGSWISLNLGSIKNICGLDIAWYSGKTRKYNFVISKSTDGALFTDIFSSTSSGTTVSPEKYNFPTTNASFVRVTVNGNTDNDAASIIELDVFGPV